MLTSQQFCVKWNSYSSNLQSVFPRLLNSEHFVDITLACEGQMIKCHKVVLSACSTYFEKLLVQNPCQHPIIFMKDMKHWEVQALVDFMYKGEVNVSQEELNSLLVAAEALQIRGLCGSDTSSNQQDGNKPVLPLSKLPSVTLPNDIVLSGGTSAGQESYQKKRKLSSDEKEQLSTLMPRITGVTSVNTNQTSSDSTATHPTSATDQSKDDGTTEEGDDDMNVSKIKQEMEIEDHFISGEGDIDVQEEDAGNEQQEDSDSNNREDVHSNAHLDQPGPSGIATATNPGEKASTELNAFALQNVMCVLSPSSSTSSPSVAGKIPIMSLANSPDLKEYIPMPSPGSSPGSTRVRRSEAELRKAAECVQKGMTFQNVSDAFNIPISTIRFYMARRGILPQRRRGRISNSSQNPAASQSQQSPYMVLHYKLSDIHKKTS